MSYPTAETMTCRIQHCLLGQKKWCDTTEGPKQTSQANAALKD